jgi:hypothetical protein
MASIVACCATHDNSSIENSLGEVAGLLSYRFVYLHHPLVDLIGDRQIQTLAWRSRLTTIPPSDLQLIFIGGAIALWLPQCGDRQIKTLAWRSRLVNISPSDLRRFFVLGTIALLLPQ